MSDEAKDGSVAREQKAPQGEYKVVLVLFVISMALFVDSLRSEGIFQGRSAGPGSIPQLASGVLVLMLVGLAIRFFRTDYREGSFADLARHLFDRDVVVLLVTLTIYGFIVEKLHFIPATFLFLVTTMYLLDRRKLLQKIIISAGTLTVLYVIFSTVFRVVLP